MMNSPMLFLLLLLDMKKTNPTAINGIARTDMSAENPRSEISQAVTVVPIFAPIITPIALVRESSPAFTKLTTITVVALEDWIMAVIIKPVRTLLKGLEVMDAKNDLSRSPAAFPLGIVKICGHNISQQTISVDFPNEIAGAKMIGNVGWVLCQQITDNLADWIIPLFLERFMDAQQICPIFVLHNAHHLSGIPRMR